MLEPAEQVSYASAGSDKHCKIEIVVDIFEPAVPVVSPQLEEAVTKDILPCTRVAYRSSSNSDSYTANEKMQDRGKTIAT